MSMLSLSSCLAGLPLALQKDPTMWMPRQSSTLAPHMDDLFYAIFYICLFFLVLVTAVLLIFIWKYRARPGHDVEASPHHNFALEVTWSVLPLFLVIVIFWIGYKGYLDLITPPPNAMEVAVTGTQWKWFFTYPDGMVAPELHAPAATPVVLTMTSEDVLHAMFIPDFRIKQDVVPGRYTKVWFEAPQPGEHDLYCAEYCGTSHSDMITKAIIHEPGGFEKWQAAERERYEQMPPVELGRITYESMGCKQCHTIDGTASTGPTLKGVFGHDVKLADGSTVLADENYIRESVLEPQAKVVAGFDPVMPTFKGKLSDKRITGIIEYLKTLE
jgi:cytochrome c oxidase subunit II